MDVFLSYARQDGEAFTLQLHDKLAAAAIPVWMDRAQMRGNASWWRQIRDELDKAEFLVLVATPGAAESPNVAAELRYARQHGVCIYGVMVPGYPVDSLALPNWFKKQHVYNLDREWDKFVQHLQEACIVNRVPFMAPEIDIQTIVERHEEMGQVLSSFLDDTNPVATTVALRGPGGFGKTTIAAAVCYDQRIETAFDEGVLWTTLGKQPDLLAEITKMYRALTGEMTTFIDVEEASKVLAERLEDQDMLMVIDDVWDRAHLRPFLRGGERVARLITTRSLEVAAVASEQISIEHMRSDEAVRLLTSHLLPADLAPFQDLARRLGDMPMMLQLVGEAIYQRVDRGESIERALAWVNTALERKGLQAFDAFSDSDRHQALSRTIEVSLELLPESNQALYFELSVFPEDADIPLSAAGALWGMDEFDTEDLISTLFSLSLLNFDFRAATFRLHDVLREYARSQVADMVIIHDKLIRGWGDLYDLPDDFAWRWLSYHLLRADRAKELRELLLDFNWVDAKFGATSPNALLIDFARLGDDDTALGLVESALRNMAHIIVEDPAQLAGQLIGRLMWFDHELIQNLVQQAREYCLRPWLEPQTPSLPQAGGPLLRTMEGHQKIVRAAKILPDGKRVASVGSDGLLKLWSLENGIELASWEAHDGDILNDVAATDEVILTAGSDGTVRVFDISSGDVRHILAGHNGTVESIAVEGNIAVSGGSDDVVNLWNIDTGKNIGALQGHEGIINVVEIYDNLVISGGSDKTVRVWSLSDQRDIHCLYHDSYVNALTVSDGYIYTGDKKGYVAVWSLEDGELLHHFRAHKEGIYGIKAYNPGQLITASADCTAILWDTDEPGLTLVGHKFPINDLEVTPDGKLAVTASADKSLKVWRLTGVVAEPEIEYHTDRTNSVALTPRGKLAITASGDETLKVWDLTNFTLSKTLRGHSRHVNDIVITSNGRFVISAASDGYLKRWDLVSGEDLWSHNPHDRAVTALALSADEKELLCGFTDGTLKRIVVATGIERSTLTGHDKRINALAWSPDDRFAVSAAGEYFGRNHGLCLWDLETGTLVKQLEGHRRKVNSIAFGRDCFVTASDDYTVKVWDMFTGEERYTISRHREHVNAVFVHGRFLFSGGEDGWLSIWQLEDGQWIVSFNLEDAISAICVGDDGETVVAGGASGKVHFLKLRCL